jgi:hypothetical protein
VPRQHRPLTRAIFAFTAVVVLACSTPGFAQPAAVYVASVEQYSQGDADRAIRRIAPFSRSRLSPEVIKAIRQMPDGRMRSAVMMHTELAAGLFADGQALGAITQIDNAERLVDLLAATRGGRAGDRTFALRWYAFGIGLYAAQGLFEPAYRLVRDGLMVVPGAAELYVARGCVHETRAITIDHEPRYGTAGERMKREIVRLMEVAATDFQTALRTDPTLAIANLHRGWIHYQLGDGRATAELAAALQDADDDGTLYLAHLFLGAAAERRNDLEDARRHFEAAQQGVPYQTAYVALARVEASLGHIERARQLSAEYTQLAEKAEDPWWNYRLGGFGIRALEWLRQEARRR